MQDQIRNTQTPRDALTLARQNNQQVRPDWHAVNLNIMLHVLRTKFNQQQNLKNLLLNTGDAVLVENAGAHDEFFGGGTHGTGSNHLGLLLMHVRAELAGKVHAGTPYQPVPPSHFPQQAIQTQTPQQQQPRVQHRGRRARG